MSGYRIVSLEIQFLFPRLGKREANLAFLRTNIERNAFDCFPKQSLSSVLSIVLEEQGTVAHGIIVPVRIHKISLFVPKIGNDLRPEEKGAGTVFCPFNHTL